MKTYELIREGEVTTDGRLIIEGATTWRDPIPVVDYTGGAGGIIGKMVNLRREGNSIYGDTVIDAACVTVSGMFLSDTVDLTSIDSFEIREAVVSHDKEMFPWRDKDAPDA